MAEEKQAFGLFLFFITFTCHGGFSEPYDQNGGTADLFEVAHSKLYLIHSYQNQLFTLRINPW